MYLKKIEILFCGKRRSIFPPRPLLTQHLKMSTDLEYAVFIPCVQRKYKMDEATKKPMTTESGENLYDRDRTERELFWVFKQLNWGFINEVRVFGFDDKSKKNVTARISFSSRNPRMSDLFKQLDAGDTAEVNHPRGFWHVVKYTPKQVEPQVTYKIKVKSSAPSTPPLPAAEFKPIVKPSANKFKILPVESDGEEVKNESEEVK
jgi:hypothetical protein